MLSRRAYLLPAGNPGDPGYVHGWLRDPNQDGNLSDSLWPLTSAPVFNQMGGDVPAGFTLVITHTPPAGNTTTVYYTTDGSDPRAVGGAVGATAQTYSAPILLTQLVTVRSRVFNTTTSEWSALTEATFRVATVQPTAASIVVSEIQYNPVGGDTFEFIRMTNIGIAPCDVTKLKFTAGITFDFALGNGTGSTPAPAVQVLNPGQSAIVVKSVAGFQGRFGTAYDSQIAGNYGTTNLNNGGEQVRLDHVDGVTTTVLKDFVYDDEVNAVSGNWPTAPDGQGPSLLLIAPETNPNHNLASSWTSSALPGGLNGRNMNYAAFRDSTWTGTELTNPAISGMTADPDGDGLINLLEYALGGNARRSDAGSLGITAGRTAVGLDDYLSITFRVRPGLTDVTITPEVTPGLAPSSWSAATVQVGAPMTNADGTLTYTFRDIVPIDASTPQRFMHVKVTSP